MIKYLFFMLLLCGHAAFAQDIIVKRSGDTLRGKVTRVDDEKIEYHNDANDARFLFTTDVRYIFYPNGTSDTFRSAAAPPSISAYTPHGAGVTGSNSGLGITLAERGEMDAKRYYHGWWGSFFGSMYPFYGLIPAIVCSVTPPSYERLHFPDPQLMDHEEYSHAYKRKAFRIKQTRTWEGFAIGTGATLAIIVGALLVH